MTYGFQKLPSRHSITKYIMEQFTEMIREGKLKVGDKLPSERELSEQFGVGRTTIRESLKSMASLGLIQTRQGEGTFIKNIDLDSIKVPLQWGIFLNSTPVNELVDLRMLLELKMVEEACFNRTATNLTELEESIKLLTSKPENIAKPDLSFHMTIAKSSNNTLMYHLLDLIRLSLEEWFEKVLSNQSNFEQTIQEHRMILESIKERNVEQAVRQMKSHLERGTERLLEIISDSNEK